MVLTDPTPIVNEDRHQRQSPIASLLRASDLALLVPKPEVVVVGSAHAPHGQQVNRMKVSLEVLRDGATLVAKALQIVGPRRAPPGSPPPEPSGFEHMPLIYERAYGGLRHRDNPVGVGMEAGADGQITWPSVLRSSGDERTLESRGMPAGFGPIPAVWPARKDKRGSLSHGDVFLAPSVTLTEDFDDAYFQTAPANQQLNDLQAGDTIILTGMHPLHQKLRATLPTTSGVAVAQTRSGKRTPLALRIDTVHLEPDGMRAEIVWRGAMFVTEDELDGLRVAGALEEPGQPAVIPDLASLGSRAAEPQAPPKAGLGSTVELRPEAPQPSRHAPNKAPESPSKAFGGTQILEPSADEMAAMRRPPPPAPPPPQAQPERFSGTMLIEPEPAQPSHEGARRASTMEISRDSGPSSLPFAGRKSVEAVSERTPPPPGSPWASDPASAASPQAVVPGQKQTLVDPQKDLEERIQEALRERAANAKAAEASAKPVMAEPPQPKPQPIAASEVKWRVDASTPVADAKPLPAALPRPDLKGRLYKKLKK